MSDFIIYVGLWNLIVFIMYGIDKKRATRGDWRISEKTLLISALLFGGLGALYGGKIFHHKTRKWYFVASWWIGIIIILALGYLVWRM